MKRIMAFICIFISAGLAFAEDQIATTKDGKTVILKSNNTWSYAETPKAERGNVEVTLLELNFHESNASNNWANDYSDWLAMAFKFESHLTKTAKAIKGVIVFSDLFGEPWMRIGMTLSNPIPPNGTFEWRGGINYSIMDPAHKKARTSTKDSIMTTFEISSVIFEDGTRLDF